jgi:hypothetical protein
MQERRAKLFSENGNYQAVISMTSLIKNLVHLTLIEFLLCAFISATSIM